MNRKIKFLILGFVIFLSAFLRIYKLDKVPPSLNWDEVAAGYNAFTIGNWGRDEWGRVLPIVFESFRDDKHPVHIYITAIFVKIFGLSDFITRLPSAIMGILSVVAIYYLARRFFRSEAAAVFSALFLAVSSYHLQFSRGLWEANFALSLFLGGLAVFFRGLEKKNYLIPIAFGLFGLSFFSYHSAKIVVPAVVALLCLIHYRDLIADRKMLVWSALVVIFFAGLIVKEPRILGFARINQTRFSDEVTKDYGGKTGIFISNYKKYFDYSYLFQKGDQNARASVKVVGQFYKIDLVFLVIGVVGLLFRKRWKELAILGVWLVASPVAGAISSLDPSALRGIFMIGPVILLSGGGAGSLISLLRIKELKAVGIIIILAVLGREVSGYLNYYYTSYAEKEAIEWQHGMKQAAEFVKENPNYLRVYVDKIRQQPYIFFLYYLKTPLPDLLGSVEYDQTESKSYNTVSAFDKYQFGGWDIVESYPGYKILYIITPSYYTGLRYKDKFNVEKLIKYPNGTDAFYLISGHEL